MKKIIATILLVLMTSSAYASVGAIKVCDAKALSAGNANLYGLGNGLTDCAVVELPASRNFSYQVYCNETTDDSMSVDVDFVVGSATATLAVPVGIGQLKTAYATEAAWSAIASIDTPIATYGTLRFTENNNDTDIVCSAILNVGEDAADATNSYTVSAAITADTGSAQGGSPLVSDINILTVVGSAGDSVTLPVAEAGLVVTVINTTATSADIFPASGGTINAVAQDGAYAIATLRTVVCHGLSTTTWQCTYSAR